MSDPGPGNSYSGGGAARSSAERRRLTRPIERPSFLLQKKPAAPPAGVGGGLAHSRLTGDLGNSILVGRSGVRSTIERDARD